MLRLIGLTIAILALALAIASGVVYVIGPANEAATGPDGLAISGVFLAIIVGLPAIVAFVSLVARFPVSRARAWALSVSAAVLTAEGIFMIEAFRLRDSWSQSILLYQDEGGLSTRALTWLHHLSALGWCVLFAGLAELAVCATLVLARGHRRQRTASA